MPSAMTSSSSMMSTFGTLTSILPSGRAHGGTGKVAQW